ncbi:ABC transporter permease [Luteibaculum oceani]|uniref:ABC transporter permease n=2 Tax=Luteibaculum oceani TaxID=1294296 RepID=A0A5C6UXN9_9FLAO|nr:ABC transporter permease [Luteibaculum oceani]
MLGGQFTDEATLTSIRAKYGLDKSLSEQYLNYLERLSPIGFSEGLEIKAPDLGLSYRSGRPVWDILAETIPNSFILALFSIGLAMILGVLLGAFAAFKKGEGWDKFIIAISALGMAGPSFFVGMLISWLFGFKWSESFSLPIVPILLLVLYVFIYPKLKRAPRGKWVNVVFLGILAASFWLPGIEMGGTGLDMTGSLYEIDPFKGRVLNLKSLILPTLTLGIRPLSVIVQLTRNSLLDVLSSDYIRTAKAKGLSDTKIFIHHALAPALNPVITAASGWFAGMLAGAVFVEFIFGWRGLGLELFEALQNEDQPVVMGAVLFFAAVFVIINILVDISYAYLDPRIRLNKS